MTTEADYVPAVPELTGRTSRYAPVPVETKAQIIEDAKGRIMDGDTLAAIAKDYGITETSLNMWLLALGDEYTDLRQRWIDNKLTNAANSIEQADDPLKLARARETWRVATWYAERRDPVRYGQLANIPVGPGISIHLNMLRAPQQPDTGQVIDIEPA